MKQNSSHDEGKFKKGNELTTLENC